MTSLFRNPIILVFGLFCIIFFYGCNTNEKNKDIIVVEGITSLPANDKIFFYTYPDTLAVYSEIMVPIDTAVIDLNGKFSFKITSKHPLVFNLEDGTQELAVNLFACPGDIIGVNFSGKNFTPQFNISSIAGKFNAYLTEFIDSFYRAPSIKQEYYIASNYMDGHVFAGYNDKRKSAQHNFFEKYFQGIELREEYTNYAVNVIEYGIAVDRLMYVWKKRIKNETVVLDSDYFDFETPEFIENKLAFFSPSYIRFLNMYIKDIYDRNVENGELISTPENNLNPSVEKYKLATKLLNRPYRDAVLYSLIKYDMHNVTNATGSQALTNMPIDSMVLWFKETHSLQ